MLRDGSCFITDLKMWKYRFSLASYPQFQNGTQAIKDAYYRQWRMEGCEAKFDIDFQDQDMESWARIFTQFKLSCGGFQQIKDQFIASTGLPFSQHSSRTEPFEINGKPIPMDFLKACLAFD